MTAFIRITVFSALCLFCSQLSVGQAIPVKIKKEGDGYQLMRGGEPYYVKGAGGQIYLDRVVAYGGNSLRTWGPDGAKKVLDDAHAKGLTVTVGLWVGQERQGFNYDDEWAVKGQFEYFKEVVMELKDHPALLVWGVGNEIDLMYSNFKVWDAINDIAKMIHEVDGNHPTMVVTAGIDVAEIQLIKERAPEIDILGINTYGGIFLIPKSIELFGWDGPYMITEWGSNGHWEVPLTEWSAPCEPNSSAKAKNYLNSYETYIKPYDAKCVGSYVFQWSRKQEVTPTWYGMFLEDGTETESVDVIQKCWSGKWPENRTPKVKSYTLDGKVADQSVYLSKGGTYSAKVEIVDPEGKALRYAWEVLPEKEGESVGGDFEEELAATTISEIERKPGSLTFKAPSKPGPYRLYVYGYDDANNAATANIPFYVE